MLARRSRKVVMFQVSRDVRQQKRVLGVPGRIRLTSGRGRTVLQPVMTLAEVQRSIDQRRKEDQSDVADIPAEMSARSEFGSSAEGSLRRLEGSDGGHDCLFKVPIEEAGLFRIRQADLKDIERVDFGYI